MSIDKNNLSDTFSQRLKLLIADNDLTQTEVADAVGVSQAAVNKWLHGTLPGIEDVSKLAGLFKCTFNQMLGWPDKENLRKSFAIPSVIADLSAGGFEEQQAAFNRMTLACDELQTSLDLAERSIQNAKRHLSGITLECDQIQARKTLSQIKLSPELHKKMDKTNVPATVESPQKKPVSSKIRAVADQIEEEALTRIRDQHKSRVE